MDTDNSQFCVNIFCVMPSHATEATCPKDLFLAHECCKENGFNVTWIQEAECMKLKPCKEDVFILSEFTGSLFDYLRRFKSTVIGPQCLLVSVQKGEPLPEVPTPVFTVAMKGLVVTTTGCSPQEKKAIQEKVQFMGGTYSSAFINNVTHLIVKSVAEFSLKYKVAVSKDIPIMVPGWVEAVWSHSIRESIHATDPIFAKYACPPFQGLVVCVSQIPSKEREALKKIIESNGGQYSGQLEMGKTKLLIATSAEGEKYTYARRWKIRCLKPDWIHQSLSKGYAVDPDEFIVEKANNARPRCSTPEADQTMPRFSVNASINSTILNESRVQHVDETVGSAYSILQPGHQQQQEAKYTDAVDTIDLMLSKKAGPFLDGCKVFISGFDGAHMEKLRRVLNNAGVARYNSISESLSHVIAGQRVEDHYKELQQLTHKPHIVTAEWIVQSLRLQRAAPESQYLHPDYKPVISDVNKENVMKKPAVPERVDPDEDTQVVQQYLSVDQTEEEEQPSNLDRPSGIFSGLSFQLVGMEPETTAIVADLIVSNGGKVVNKKANYIVLEPTLKAEYSSPDPGASVVNTFWIEDCVDHETIVEIDYYHRPIRLRDNKTLSNCVVSFSGIQGRVRDFLEYLIGQLGGRAQETFSRKLMEDKKVYKSTHLVIQQAEGRKYVKAIEWGVPAVNPQWLVACATSPVRPKEAAFPPEGQDPEPEEQDWQVAATPKADPPAPAESVVLKSNKHKRDETPPVPTPVPRIASGYLATPEASVTPVATNPRLRPVLLDTPSSRTPGVNPSPLNTSSAPKGGLFNMPTPQTPYGRLLNTDPSPDTRKLWKHALENRVRLTPRDDPDSSRLVAEDRAPGMTGEVVVDPEAESYFENLRKKLRLDDGAAAKPIYAEEERTLPSSSSGAKPFAGVVAYLHKKIEDNRSELVRAVEALGGQVRFQHGEDVTHFIYQGKLVASKEMRNAKDWHQKFVAPQWILDCEDANVRLEEGQYPPSLNPKMALSLSFSSQAPPASGQKRRPDGTPRNRTIQEKAAEELVVPKMESLSEGEEAEAEEEEACKELLQLDQVLSRSAEQMPVQMGGTIPAARNSRGSDHVYVPATQHVSELPDSQAAPVGWDLHETQRVSDDQPAKEYRIMFSGMAQSDRDICAAIVPKLGGILIEASQYDASCSHLVVSKLGCNEKLLNSIAAGKWVLHPNWVIDSEKEGRFLDEQHYEWGNPSSVVTLSASQAVTDDEARIAAAAHYWRVSRSKGLTDGPFYGITAVLCLGSKNDSFQRLLEAGGGEVVDQEAAFTNHKTNLCIVDNRELKKLKLSSFASRGIYCVPLIYLRSIVLARDQKLSWSKSVVPEFVPYLDKMPS